MSQISGRAAVARENARQSDGKFGSYYLEDAGTDADLSMGDISSVEVLRDAPGFNTVIAQETQRMARLTGLSIERLSKADIRVHSRELGVDMRVGFDSTNSAKTMGIMLSDYATAHTKTSDLETEVRSARILKWANSGIGGQQLSRMDEEDVREAAVSSSSRMRARAAEHGWVGEHAEALSQDPNEDVRCAFARNPLAAEQHIDRICADTDRVRAHAATNVGAPKLLEALSRDPNPIIAQAARDSLSS